MLLQFWIQNWKGILTHILQLVSYKCLVSFSGGGKQHYNKNKCRVFCGFIIIMIFRWYLTYQTADNRAPLCNIIPPNLWINFLMECGPLSENSLSMPLQIHLVDWPAGSFSSMSCSITGYYRDFKKWWSQTTLSISWYMVSNQSATWASPASISIHRLNNVDLF